MLQQTTYHTLPAGNRADFNRNDYEVLINQKGRNVILEKGLQCPCKSKGSNQQSNCKNCGGSGWIFINPKETRMVLQGMNITPDYKAWSEEITGDLRVTASDTEEISFMDRITVTDAKSIFNEVLFFKTKNATKYAYTSYDVKDVLYIGYFQGTEEILLKLTQGIDYTFNKNVITITNPALVAVQGSISVTVRYIHAPSYLIIDMKRESMETFVIEGTEKKIHLPVSAIARKSHYKLDASNLAGDRLLDNSY